MKRCIINFAKGGWYPQGQRRLAKSIREHGHGIDFIGFEDESQFGCPAHRVIPYAFKPFAFIEAKRRGYDTILWLDASMYAVRDLTPMFEHIEANGHVMFESGFNCAQYTNDATLSAFHISRDEAEMVLMISAGCLGLHIRDLAPAQFLSTWIQSAYTFPGCHHNDGKTESQDPRCKGHRHDQSAASLIAGALEMPLLIGHDSFFQYWPGDESKLGKDVCITARGLTQ